MADDGRSKMTWAHQGEAVTCVNGHPVCHVARTIHVGDARSPDDFCDWSQAEPDRSQPVPAIRCTVCHGAWVRGDRTSGYQFHFGTRDHGGWR